MSRGFLLAACLVLSLAACVRGPTHELVAEPECNSAQQLNGVPFGPFHQLMISRNEDGRILGYRYTLACGHRRRLADLQRSFRQACDSHPDWRVFHSEKGEGAIGFALNLDGRCEPAIRFTKAE